MISLAMSQHPLYERPDDLRRVIETLLLDMASRFQGETSKDHSQFNLRTSSMTSFSKYLQRIFTKMRCSGSCHIIALILIERAITQCSLRISPYNVHKLYMTALLIATKTNDDEYYTQTFYSKVAGMTEEALYELELSFFEMVKYSTIIESQIFQHYLEKLTEYEEVHSSPIKKQKI